MPDGASELQQAISFLVSLIPKEEELPPGLAREEPAAVGVDVLPPGIQLGDLDMVLVYNIGVHRKHGDPYVLCGQATIPRALSPSGLVELPAKTETALKQVMDALRDYMLEVLHEVRDQAAPRLPMAEPVQEPSLIEARVEVVE